MSHQQTKFPHSHRAKMIAVASGKGGVGKSSLSANLGIALAKKGKRVCVFDADTNLGNINILLGLQPKYTLKDLLSGEQQLDDVLFPGPGGIQIVAAASGVAEFVNLHHKQQERLLDALHLLESRFDYLLIDIAAGANDSVLNLLMASPSILITITQDPTSLTDAFSVLKLLKQRGGNANIQVIVNMANKSSEALETYFRFKRATAKYLQIKLGFSGYVLRDPHMSKAVKHQIPILLQYPNCPASRCISAVAERINNLLNDFDMPMFSDFFSERKSTYNNSAIHNSSAPLSEQILDTPCTPWIESALTAIKKGPVEEISGLISQFNSHWQQRLEKEKLLQLDSAQKKETAQEIVLKVPLSPQERNNKSDSSLLTAIHFACQLDPL